MKTKTIVLSVVASALPALCIANNKLNMVIGTYTDNGSKGVYSFLFDQQTGKATTQHSLALKNPSYLAFAPNGRYFYAVSENNDTTASLNAIAFERDGSMKLVNTQRTHGEDPCYVDETRQASCALHSIHKRWLYVSNKLQCRPDSIIQIQQNSRYTHTLFRAG